MRRHVVGLVPLATYALSACAPPPPPPLPPDPLMQEVAALPEPLRIVIDPELLRQVERARGLLLDGPLDVRTLTRPELAAMLRDQAEAELPRDFLRNEGEMLRALGAIPASTNWKALLLDELTHIIEGVWIARSNKLILTDLINHDRDALIRHELVHALQDRHFGLDGLLSFLPGESDRQAARLHLVEGDAVETVGRIGISERERSGGIPPAPKKTEDPPPYLGNLLASPYKAGGDFARALYLAGGTGAIDRAFADPPVSTEQVLHPKKYLERELPLKVMLPNLPREGAVWEHIDTFGELALGTLFAEWVGSGIGHGVASGWGGDRIALGKTNKGKVATLVVAMDSRELADRISIALADVFPKGCRDRLTYGALAFAQQDELIGFFAGPYVDGEVMPTCAEAQRELALVLRGVQIVR